MLGKYESGKLEWTIIFHVKQENMLCEKLLVTR